MPRPQGPAQPSAYARSFSRAQSRGARTQSHLAPRLSARADGRRPGRSIGDGACLAPRGVGTRRRTGGGCQALRPGKGRRRRVLRQGPAAGHDQLQRRGLRAIERRGRGRCAFQAIGRRFADCADQARGHRQAGALRGQHALPLGPHAGRPRLSADRSEGRLHRQQRDQATDVGIVGGAHEGIARADPAADREDAQARGKFDLGRRRRNSAPSRSGNSRRTRRR